MNTALGFWLQEHTFDEHVLSSSDLYAHRPCFQAVFSTRSSASRSRFGVLHEPNACHPISAMMQHDYVQATHFNL